MPFDFMQIDAFTDNPLGGNPCAVVFDASELSTETMQAVAQEMNLSETSFVMPSDIADFKVRYFTPAEEIPMAGHPTIATTFALIKSGRLKLNGSLTTITLEMQVGPIKVDIESEGELVKRITMTQKKPVFMDKVAAKDVLPVIGLAADDLLPGYDIQIVSTGTPQLMIPLKNKAVLKRVQIDAVALGELRDKAGFFSSHLFCLEGATEEGDTFARHFASPPDIFEDPFTGSATGNMAAYVWRYGLIKKPQFIAEQGHWMGRPGQAFVEVIGSANDIEAVKVGGNAAIILQGELFL